MWITRNFAAIIRNVDEDSIVESQEQEKINS